MSGRRCEGGVWGVGEWKEVQGGGVGGEEDMGGGDGDGWGSAPAAAAAAAAASTPPSLVAASSNQEGAVEDRWSVASTQIRSKRDAFTARSKR